MTTCGFIGMSVRVPRSSISSFQLFMRSCDFLRNLLLFVLEKRKQSLKHGFCIAYKRNVNRMAQTDARRINLDLHAFRLTGLGQELHVRESWCRS